MLPDTIRQKSTSEPGAAVEVGKQGEDALNVASDDTHSIMGVLLALRHLMPLLESASDSNDRKNNRVGVKSNEPDARVNLALTVKVSILKF
jgi:hypothetical protein